MAVEGVTSLFMGSGDPSRDIASFIGETSALPPTLDVPAPHLPGTLPAPLDDAAIRARRDEEAAGYAEPAKAVPSDYHGGPPLSEEDAFEDTDAPPVDDVDDPWGVRDAVNAAVSGAGGNAPFGADDDLDGDAPVDTTVAEGFPTAAPSSAYTDDDYDDDTDGEDYRLSKPSFGDRLSKPLEFFKQSPKLGRTAAVGAVGLVAAIGAGVMFGGSTASETPVATLPSVVEEAPGLDAPSAEVTTLLPKAVAASCPPGSTSPSMAFTNRPENAWKCIRAHGIDGAVLNITFPRTAVIKSITVMPGWNYVAPNGRDHWNEHRLVTKILWRIGGQQFEQNITPTRSGSTLTLPGNGIATTVMSLTILTTERPDALSTESGEGGGFLAPGGDTGPENTEVDESTAIGSITIMGSEI